ncbi:hypothetical protein H4218_001439 [Coemansia sp. IMI 209128]|nr:hypothetical protein H4218_001439 [Coemansia sp. IMI 209128]
MSDSGASPAASERGKAREKLREYYKIQAPPPQQQHRPPTSSSLKQQLQPPLRRAAKTAPPNPLDIDTQAFDARKYLKKALLEQGVSELLATDIKLVGQVRQIDGDMKTMVYENYSEFIRRIGLCVTRRSTAPNGSDEPLDTAGPSGGGPSDVAPAAVPTAGTTRLSLVVGFASQFVSPSGSGLLDQTPVPLQPRQPAGTGAQNGRTMSLLEATTEGTVVGLLSPLSEDNQAQLVASEAAAATAVNSASRREQLVVGWQAMSKSQLGEAQRVFAEHMKEWSAEYEFIIDSLIHFPDDATQANAPAYLAQVDELVACTSRFPILARIGGLNECMERVVTQWQQRLVDGALHTIVRDMIERLEYYFDPSIDQVDAPQGVSTPLQGSTAVAGNMGSLPRNSGAVGGRHQRNSSVKSTGSQTSHPPPEHQRSGSVLSNTWTGGVPSSVERRVDLSSSPMGLGATQGPGPHSPLQVITQQPPSNARGLAHAHAVSSAFEALGNPPSAPLTAPSSLSPALAPYSTMGGGSGSSQRLARASTASAATARLLIHNNAASGSRTGALRRTRHIRSISNAFTDSIYESLDDGGRPALSEVDANLPPPQLRRSFSLHRNSTLAVRRYRPWLVNTVNRNAPLHVFLADVESWLIQQVLERVNPLLETVVQHYLDIEASQMLDDDDEDSSSSTGLVLQSATRMRQTFIKTLDRCLNTWMSSWIPEAFLYATLANPIHGTRSYVEQTIAESPMAQFGISTLSDPVSSLLLARFAVDFELTLTQSIYQLCEHGISILPDETLGVGASKRAGLSSTLSSADVSTSNLLTGSSARNSDPSGEPPSSSDRLYSITASLAAARNDSMASATSRRGTFATAGGAKSTGSVLNTHRAEHAAKWHGVAEKLVKHFVMTVGQDISSDYLNMHPYDSLNRAALDDIASNRRISTYSVSSSVDLTPHAAVSSVSEVWLSMCRWMKQVEGDTNALFHDPVFWATIKALEAYQTSMHGEHASDYHSPVATYPAQQQAIGGFTGANALRLGVAGDKPSSSSAAKQSTGYNPLLHAHILSNIDRLFAERVDIFPKRITSLASGQILFHLAMQIIKSAIEALRLNPGVLRTATEFQQVVVDSVFIRSWMLRYAGVSPNLKHPSVAPVTGQPQQQEQLAFVGEQRRRSAMASSSNAHLAATAAASSLINERDAQAIQNLIDDWIGSAKTCAMEQAMPDSKLVDKVVRNAWMSVYFVYDNMT